ncbi:MULTISPECIES: hypothetical protein [Lysinibacillus]|uniref:DUF2269 family protein n=1 Tax=Lysinibacillus antri TaxID=2498145 RepID=A0A432LBQ8_9BACI|nr:MULTISPECIES: hypothetical protein [Lysinibacillus]RUL52088.1 hypothetical protein EK386_10875 [Lysinibacillus antri]TSI06025.1 hypothetical protein FJQ64_11500 [Lysinibacillus sp. BW-2-10]
MFVLHTIFLYIHILSAVVSIGPLFALIPTLKKMQSAEEALLGGFVQSFQSAITVVKHAGHVLVLSGVVLVLISGWTWTTSWILLTIAVAAGSIVFLARAFKPTLKTFGTKEFNKEVFIAKLRKATWQYILLLLLMLWLMVAKPTLW